MKQVRHYLLLLFQLRLIPLQMGQKRTELSLLVELPLPTGKARGKHVPIHRRF
jgi:hypothetical protein